MTENHRGWKEAGTWQRTLEREHSDHVDCTGPESSCASGLLGDLLQLCKGLITPREFPRAMLRSNLMFLWRRFGYGLLTTESMWYIRSVYCRFYPSMGVRGIVAAYVSMFSCRVGFLVVRPGI